MSRSLIQLRYRIWYNFLFFLLHFFGDRVKLPLSNHRKRILQHLKSLQFQYKNTEPAIFTEKSGLRKGMVKNWTATKTWSFDYFKKNYGDKDILIIDNKGVVDPNAPQEAQSMKLSQYLDELQEGSLKYLKLSNLAQKELSLQEDLDIAQLRSLKEPFSFGETFYSFIGGENTITPLHNEFPTTVYMQIVGKKKWTIFPPKDDIFLDVTTERRTYFFSSFAPGKNDKKHPLSKYAQKYEVILEPGDVLIIPPFYWHYVENITKSIGVAYKYANLFNGFKSSKLLTILFLLSTKPSIFYSFFASRILKDDYVLSKKK